MFVPYASLPLFCKEKIRDARSTAKAMKVESYGPFRDFKNGLNTMERRFHKKIYVLFRLNECRL